MARYKKGASARDFDLFGHKLPFYAIQPSLVKAHAVSDETLRSEYTRLRDIAQKRLKRMAGKPEARETYSQHAEGFPKIRELEDRGDLVRALIDVSSFLTARRGSMSGIRETNKQIIRTMADKGITIRKQDLRNYGNFMTAMRKLYHFDRGEYASDQFRDLWIRLNESGSVTQAQYEKEIQETVARINAERPEDQARISASKGKRLNADFFREENLNPRTAKALKRKK